MPKTLLAVDDSVTMRKVLEITFSADDFNVITAEDRDAALAMAGEADVFVVDTVLGGADGYAVGKELLAKNGRAVLLFLASRYNPYDANRGKEAGAADYADKPFDTQQLIDKVNKALAAGPSSAVGGSPAAAAGSPYRAPAPPVAAVAASSPPPAVPKGTQQSLGGARSQALGAVDGAARAPAAPGPMPARPPAATTTPSAPPPARTAQSAVGAAVNGQLASKLGDVGLSAEQVDAVLALSRDVVEQIVWEVVPQLAETLIKEEIARLMAER